MDQETQGQILAAQARQTQLERQIGYLKRREAVLNAHIDRLETAIESFIKAGQASRKELRKNLLMIEHEGAL